MTRARFLTVIAPRRAPVITPVITSDAPPAPTYNSAYSHSYTADVAVSWSVTAGELPVGLSLNTTSGALTGTPLSAGEYAWTVTATHPSGGTDTQAASGTVVINKTIHHAFPTNASGPLTSPNTADPGPGALTLVQNNGAQWSIAANALHASGGSASSWSDLLAYFGSVSRTPGLLLTWKHYYNGLQTMTGWASNNTAPDNNMVHGVWLTSTASRWLQTRADGISLAIHDPLVAGTWYQFYVALFATGAQYGIKGGTYLDWQRTLVSPNSSAATLYALLSRFSNSQAPDWDDFQVVPLGPPFTSAAEIAVINETTAVSDAIYPGVANGQIELRITAPSPLANSGGFKFRAQDSGNCLYIYCDANGSLILASLVEGVPTVRQTVESVISAGQTRTIMVRPSGTRIDCYTAATGTYTERGTGLDLDYLTEMIDVIPVAGEGWTLDFLRAYPREHTAQELSVLHGVWSEQAYLYAGPDWYVAEGDGSPANGDLADPFTSLAQAFANVRMKAGHTIWLRGGTHPITADCKITLDNITVRPYPNEAAIIEFAPVANTFARLLISGAYVKFRDLEICSATGLNRESPAFGNHDGLQLGFLSVANMAPSDGSFQNCYLHNLASNICYGNCVGGVVYQDCTLLNWGWQVTGEPAGTGDGEFLYTQNFYENDLKKVLNCIFGTCFSVALQAYNESPYNGRGRVYHYLFQYCIWLQSGSGLFISPGQLDATDFTLDNCALLDTKFLSAEGNSIAVTNSDLVQFTPDNSGVPHQFGVMNASSTVTDNRWWSLALCQCFQYNNDNPPAGYTWDRNAYHGAEFSQNRTFANWKSTTGLDANSTWTASAPASAWTKVNACLASSYPRVAHLSVVNPAQADTVAVDVSSLGLTPGATYRVRSALNPKIDYADIVYGGTGTITVTMADRSVAQPRNYAGAWKAADKRIGAFVLEAR